MNCRRQQAPQQHATATSRSPNSATPHYRSPRAFPQCLEDSTTEEGVVEAEASPVGEAEVEEEINPEGVENKAT